ncbi:prolyl-tRNA synthetase [Buchnera aphidicola str. Ak (Acyrthosiphon kondoi)]|uniref:Proline--tRNA ligase n=1 Tax=Buchnera aphidicola str. Ak (Acyrthosiphon kondoi) TaxID=1005090 RepID=G2LMV8_9GAMM|nr:proline--tRNA ligase [Buchnera aphidicola]AEO08596.1 prolyl-tRNA synthetase [Buchnera aphidicola str. Ak (Acyrthosiphon kondoi)]
MLTSQYLLSTLKDIPYDAKIISHQLMLRSGMIRKISSGLYIWLPTGIRVLKKIKKIIKKEMKKINALEILMPIVQPEYLWKESGRLNIYGEELLKFSDRRNNQFILGPTNEEVITNFIGSKIHSYKELPLILYQIQTKFRDETRPRFGIIRTREFMMKDAYSFHINQNCLEDTYNKFRDSYIKIFKKMKLDFCIVKAESGSMGGNISHEFQAFSNNGEDEIVFSDDKTYASNINMAESIETINFFKKKDQYEIVKDKAKSKKSIIISEKLNTPLKNQIKTFLVKTKIKNITSIAALLIRGDHELNLFKIEKIDILKKPLVFLDEKETIALIGVKKKFLGPYGLKIPIIADISTYTMKDFTIGSNIDKHFFINVNWNIDLPIPVIKDIRKVTEDDLSPHGIGCLNIKKSIEIGHIFQLGQKYSRIMKTSFKTKDGNPRNLYMGCYGIGITRIVAAVIEQNHDENGIIWPNSIAPFEVVILPIDMEKSKKIKKIANILYQNFKKIGIDIILDDRYERPGVMFNEMDLIGIPHQIIISRRSIENNNVEYCERKNKKKILINIKDIINFMIQRLKK